MTIQEQTQKLLDEITGELNQFLQDNDRLPTVILGNERTIREFIEEYAGQSPDWNEKVYIHLDYGVGKGCQMLVLRTMDLKAGEFYIL